MTATLHLLPAAEPPAARGPISARASQLRGSSLTELFEVARQRSAIDLAVGTPGFPEIPQSMISAASTALRTDRNQYEHPYGEDSLRVQIAQSLTTPACPDSELTITVGGTEALCIALLSTVDPGDEVIVLEPCYENFLDAIRLAGGIPRFVPLHAPDWQYDPRQLAAAFGPRTRAVLLNTPGNPTGRMHTLEELNEIAELCERWDVTVISDEVHAALVFDGRVHLSVADLPRMRGRSVVVGSLSKSHAASGWRLGFLRADPARTEVFRRVHEVTTNGAAAPLQAAAGRAGVFGGHWCTPVSELAERRDLARRLFSGLGMEFGPTEGGCFLFGDIRRLTDEHCQVFVRRLLEETAVLLVPGTPFFADAQRGRHFVRIAFNRSWETLHAAEMALGPHTFGTAR